MRLEHFMSTVVPFAAMVLVEFGDVGMISVAKVIMTSGISELAYILYSTSLGVFLLLPYFIFHSCGANKPPVTFSLLCRFFILGLIGISLPMIFGLLGVSYSSPTLAATTGNLLPVFTFLLAVMFRMEKLDIRRASSQAKPLGTIVSVSGVFMVIFYKGPEILMASSPSNSPHPLLFAQKSNWVIGGFFITVASILTAMWSIVQVATVKEFQDKTTIVFSLTPFSGPSNAHFLLFLLKEIQERGSFTLGIEMFGVLFTAVYTAVFRRNVVIWCLQKEGPIYVAMFKPLSIVIAVIIGVTFLGETLHLGSQHIEGHYHGKGHDFVRIIWWACMISEELLGWAADVSWPHPY